MRASCLYLLFLVFGFATTGRGAEEDHTWSAQLEQVRQLGVAGRMAEAWPLAQDLVRRAEEFGPHDTRFVLAANEAGLIRAAMGQYAEAEKIFLRGARLLEATGGERVLYSILLHNMATTCLESKSRLRRAEDLTRKALDLARAELPPGDPHLGSMMATLAAVWMEQGRGADALGMYEQTLRVLPDDAPAVQPHAANAWTNMGVVLANMGRLQDAAAAVLRGLEIYEKQLGPEHPVLVRPLLSLARLHLEFGQPERAETLLARAQRILEGFFAGEHPDLGLILAERAEALRRIGRKQEARDLTRRAKNMPGVNGFQTVHIQELLRGRKQK